MQDLRQRAVAAYLGLAIGDALGATTEFMTPREISQQYKLHRHLVGGGWLHLKPGSVTDDTEMSLALGEAILANAGVVDSVVVAESFSEWMRAKPVDIGHTVRRGISRYRATGIAEVAEDPHTAGNGACMRCLPIALLNWNSPVSKLLADSRTQAHVTHHCETADAGTEAVLLMLVEALRGGSLPTLRTIADQLVDRFPQFAFDEKKVLAPSGWIVETLRAVFQALFAHEDLETVLVDVVNRGGDADTTGAIAGMLAGALYGRDAIPVGWIEALDARVRGHCERQALALVNGCQDPIPLVGGNARSEGDA